MSDEREIDGEIAKRFEEQQAQIDRIHSLIKTVQKNSRNIIFLRNVGIGLVATMALGSAWDWSLSESGILPSFHGERLQTLLTAFISAGGLAFLGFKKMERKDD